MLRRALFPIRDESLFTGTYRDPEKLYKPMIDAFSRVIAKHTGGEDDEKGGMGEMLTTAPSSVKAFRTH